MDEEYIEREVRDLADRRGVIPIAARERGSRMLGVAHDDSDWDVFLLFAQEGHEYVELGGYTDTISWKDSSEDLDVHGWNVKKFANLLTDSNPNAVEFLMSENEYFNDTDFNFDRLETDVQSNFNHMALYHHYISLAKSNYSKYIKSGNDPTTNRQFYVLRAVAMAKHIRKEGTFPNVNVWDFLSQTNCLTLDERANLRYLAQAKMNGEIDEEPGDIVGAYLDAEDEVFLEPTDRRTHDPSAAIVNELIREVVQ